MVGIYYYYNFFNDLDYYELQVSVKLAQHTLKRSVL